MDREAKKAVRTTEYLINQAIRKHNLLEQGDKILIGLSGGIDSLVLLKTLAERRRYFDVQYELIAMHVRLTNISYTADRQALESFCKHYDVTLLWHEEEIKIDPKKAKKNPCFICSWHRRRILFHEAEKLGANKLALGHHRDDALETLLMNMIFHGSISSLPVRLRMFDGELTLIRPLLFLDKDIIQKYAWAYGIENLATPCPFAGKTHRRRAIAELLEQMEQIHPAAKKNLMRSMSKIFEEYLPR